MQTQQSTSKQTTQEAPQRTKDSTKSDSFRDIGIFDAPTTQPSQPTQSSQPGQTVSTADNAEPPLQTQTRKWNIADSTTAHDNADEQNGLSNTTSTEGQLRELVGGANSSRTGATMTTTVTDTDKDIESQMERLMAQINERTSRTSSSQ